MVNLESRNAIYKSKDVDTLKEAKDRFPSIRYFKYLKDSDLGVIIYSSKDDAEFIPITRNGQQLLESN